MVDKCRIIYKGDIWAGGFYLLHSVIFASFAIGLYFFTEKLGWYILSLGLAIISFYCFFKGWGLVFISFHRYKFYRDKESLTLDQLKDELDYTEYRLQKKKTNRRRYIWTTVIASLLAFIGVFLPQKSHIIGTMVPVAIMASFEFGVGLLTEFRLWAFHRLLYKTIHGEEHESNENYR